jgi:putative transposase
MHIPLRLTNPRENHDTTGSAHSSREVNNTSNKQKRLKHEGTDKIEEAFVLRCQNGWGTERIAKHLGVSSRTIQRWLVEHGNKQSSYWTGKRNTRTREPTYGDDVRARVRELHDAVPTRSATTIHRLLKADMREGCPSLQTVRRMLRDQGLGRKKIPHRKNYIKFERDFPNDMWQVDFKGWDVLGHLGKLHLLAFMDDRSRYIVKARWFRTDRAHHVLRLLRDAFESCGLPNNILSDNGSQFKNIQGDTNTTRYYRLLCLLDVKPIFHKPRHPEAKGKLERWFGFVQSSFIPEARKALDDNPSMDIEAFNKKFQEWLDWYNYTHEHSSLDGQAPAKVYLEHPRRIQRDLQAAIDWDKWIGIFETRKVTKQGMISVGGVTYTLKDGFAGREVEIQQLPGKINVFSNGELVDTIPTPEMPGASQPGDIRRINKDGYLKFRTRMYKLGARHAHKAVRVLATDDGNAVLVYDGNVLIARLDVNDGKPYKN